MPWRRASAGAVGVTEEAHIAVVERGAAVDEVAEGGFARAVLAEDAVHLAAADGEVDIRKRPHRTVTLADAGQLQGRVHESNLQLVVYR